MYRFSYSVMARVGGKTDARIIAAGIAIPALPHVLRTHFAPRYKLIPAWN